MTMKKSIGIALVFFSILLMNSCIIVSLNPCYTEDDLVFRNDFVGNWKDSDGDIWKISASAPDGSSSKYKLEVIDNDVVNFFELHIAQIGDYFFLDFFPDLDDKAFLENAFMELHRLPVHSFARMKFSGDSVQLFMLNEDWFKKQAEADKLSVPFQEVEGIQVLIASTQEIQKFLHENATNPDAFNNELVLTPLTDK